jgi:Undecaprenyl-phosphate galactose phosphotransferase WbaP
LSHLTSISLLAAAGGGVITRAFPFWCAAAWPAAIVLVPFCRAIVRKFCARREWWGYPTLVIDSAGPLGALAHSLLRSPKSGLRPVLMTDPLGHCRSSVLPVMNDAETLRSLVRTEGIRHAVVSLPDLSTADITSALDQYSDVIPHMLVLSDASTLPALWSASRGLGRLSGIEVRNGLLLATLQRVKRVLDIVVCLSVLVLGLPLLAAIAVAIKMTDPGPVLFGHTRIGQHGRRFKTWKFRTMKVNAEALLREHLAHNPQARAEWNQCHKLRDDPRVTRLGTFLRHTSLDELPQVWNVLCGEMSLVGPRPIVDDEVHHYGKAMRLYAMVKPGITGLWQSSGRNEVGYRDRVLLDEFYVRHWSPWLDVFVLAKTINALIRRKGAY